jgi:hypothetical protein
MREEMLCVVREGGLEVERERVCAPPLGKVGERSGGRMLEGRAWRRVVRTVRIWDPEEEGG